MTGEQQTIDAYTLARRTDKPSSHTGAGHAAGSIPERVALFCYALDRLGGTGTANEVAAVLIDRLRWVHWSTGPWKRASDCARLGLVDAMTDGRSRPVYRDCSVSGHTAMVWELTDSGRRAATAITPRGVSYDYNRGMRL